MTRVTNSSTVSDSTAKSQDFRRTWHRDDFIEGCRGKIKCDGGAARSSDLRISDSRSADLEICRSCEADFQSVIEKRQSANRFLRFTMKRFRDDSNDTSVSIRSEDRNSFLTLLQQNLRATSTDCRRRELFVSSHLTCKESTRYELGTWERYANRPIGKSMYMTIISSTVSFLISRIRSAQSEQG